MLRKRPENQVLRLNLGCGPVQPEGWVNVDASLRARLASQFSPIDTMLTRLRILPPTEFNRNVKILNLLKPLPYSNDCVEAIYAGELWEHFELEDAKRLTAECFRVLQPGGVIRLCVPDGATFWRNYITQFDAENRKPPQERDSTLLQQHVAMYFRDICTRRRWFGSMGHVHKWQYDEIQFKHLLSSCGFVEVERQAFHQSRIDGIDAVERSDFLIVEGVKP